MLNIFVLAAQATGKRFLIFRQPFYYLIDRRLYCNTYSIPVYAIDSSKQSMLSYFKTNHHAKFY